MSRHPHPALELSSRVLRILRVANAAFGVAILALLLASLVAEEPVLRALGVQPAADRDRLVAGMRVVMLLGIAAVPLTDRILARLLAIVGTVSTGDPFLPANATRLRESAWALLGLECLHLAVGAVAASSASAAQPLDLNWRFEGTPWLAILLLFVLARVFDVGARMRTDLEGTV